MNFFKTPQLLKKIYPSLIWDRSEDTTEKELFLTFDDGPVPEITDFVLDTLAGYQARATFFVVGNNVQKHPYVFKKIMADGHRIGNHTFHHLNGWETSNADYYNDVSACQLAMIEAGFNRDEDEQELMRPPYGKIRNAQIRYLKQLYDIVMWDVLSGDFDESFNAEKCLRKSIQYSKPGTIIIFHDSHKAAKNLKYVLPRYIENFAGQGYTFASL